MSDVISDKTIALLGMMADGQFHSGEALGKILGVSRASVWKHLQNLTTLGVNLERKSGRGYRIVDGIGLLDQSQIEPFLSTHQYRELEVFHSIGSTNRYLLEKIDAGNGELIRDICLAEMQSAGRGRRGRVWQSPFARNIYMSISWPFEGGVMAMEGLSLAVGVVVVEALAELGFEDCLLKWPNDIQWEGKKLAGVLIEMLGDMSGQCHAVIGLGLNVEMSLCPGIQIDQEWVDLKTIGSICPTRNHIVGVLLKHMMEMLQEYEEKGFTYWKTRWEEHAAYKQQNISLISATTKIVGEMLGVTDSGALRILVDGEEKTYVGGELSLRQEATYK